MRIAVRLRVLLPLLLSLAPALPAGAQTASLVRDLQPGNNFSSPDSDPHQLLAFRNKVFFVAQEPSSGLEVWVSDGTGAGTDLLADACTAESCQDPEILGKSANFVFWVADRQLWRSDGTRAGTQPLRPDTLRVDPSEVGGSFAFLNDVLYFEGCDFGGRCALWRTDGTVAGTQRVTELAPEGQAQSIIALRSAAGRLFLVSGDFGSNSFLWTSNGTAAGTAVVRQFPFLPSKIVTAGSRLFMVLPAPEGKEELWASDGTIAGTLPLASFRTFDSFDGIPWLKPIGNRVYFVANEVALGEEIWRSDGTPQGTQRVTSFGFHDPFRSRLEPNKLEEIGNRVIFLATDGLSGTRLWSAEAAEKPPLPLADVCPGCDFGLKLARLDHRVIFGGFDPAHGSELWATDGTTPGTARLTDVCAGSCDSLDSQPVAGASAVHANLRDQRGRRALWRSDGTPQGTRRLTEPENGTGNEFVLAGGKIFFAARDRYGLELWASDGTPAGSGPVADIGHDDQGSNPTDLTPLFNGVTFLANGPGGTIWTSGGTAATTTAVDSQNRFFIDDLVVAGGKIFFQSGNFPPQIWASDGIPGNLLQLTSFDNEQDFFPAGFLVEHQGHALFPVAIGESLEIWTSDGTLAGTGRAFPLPPTMRSIRDLRSLGDQLFLLAEDDQGCHPWLSDGTASGTRRLLDEDLGCFSSRRVEVARLGSIIFFTEDLIWRTDGTLAGTFPLHPLEFEDGANSLTVFQNALYYIALAPAGGSGSRRWALWRSDGTEAGTTVVREFVDAKSLVAAGSGLFLAADDGTHGTELWTSDGTAAGTVLVQDILPGLEGSNPTALTAAAGRLYFAATDAVHGTELWVSDGAGTRLAQDLAPGAPSSRPAQLTAARDRLFFTADDGLTGRELWTLPLPPDAAGACAPSDTSLCLSGGRFRVEALWLDPQGRFQPGRAVGLTPDTGYFWFFSPANVEAVVKVLDARGVNGHQWVFYGALSNVEYALTVTDIQTGLTRRYFNPQGKFASVGDNHAFGPLGAFKRHQPASPEAAPLLVREGFEPAAATGTCVPAPRRLCLTGGRFAVEARWKLPDRNGAGTAGGITGDTGYFWFFNAANIEAVVKVLDATAVNGHFWVFYGGLSNVEYELTVTDTMTGRTKTYKNPRGRFASAGDTTAF
ncbi:MAG TPA: ELWxxDGT repeat protein [Thermoanaerobaculia bacterium]|nr:ELWxxDGT repeat protein [Thermoanaerobaculia bacterium]